MEKCISSSFDVSGIITEDLAKDNNPKVNPPKTEDIKYDKEESEQEDDKQVTLNKFSGD